MPMTTPPPLTPHWRYLDAVTADALAAACANWPAGHGLLALVAERDADAVARLQAAAGARLLVGAVVPGLVVEGRFVRHGLLLAAIDAATPHLLMSMPQQDGRATTDAVAALADFAVAATSPDGGDTLFLLADVLLGDTASLLDRLYAELGDQVHYAGACAGSETFQSVPCLFDNSRFLANGVLALVLTRHPGAVLAHHYRGSDALWAATATTGSQVDTIDGRPALEVYQELMAREYGIALTRETFYRYAVHFPFALSRAQGEPLVRIPVKVGDDGSVLCSGEIRENALLTVVRAVEPGNTAAATAAGAGARTAGGSSLLAFYCAGRYLHLGEDAATAELGAMAAAAAPLPVFGALCLGEIGSGPGLYPVFQNATITAVPWR